MSPTKAPGVRARVRAQLTIEIKESAREQLIENGASSLSLRAISRELDMSSSAIYRYFASRDELLTALIIDAYNALGEKVEHADATCDRANYKGRMVAVAMAIRAWAVANPHEYALIYGSPVPGYRAPQDTVDPAIRVSTPLLAIVVEQSIAAGVSPAVGRTKAAKELAAAVAGFSEFVQGQVPPPVLAKAVSAWGEIFGLISLELFGHFQNVVDDPAIMFRHAMEALSERVTP